MASRAIYSYISKNVYIFSFANSFIIYWTRLSYIDIAKSDYNLLNVSFEVYIYTYIYICIYMYT